MAIMYKFAAGVGGVDGSRNRWGRRGENREWYPSLWFGTSNRRGNRHNLEKTRVDSRDDHAIIGFGLIGGDRGSSGGGGRIELVLVRA